MKKKQVDQYVDESRNYKWPDDTESCRLLQHVINQDKKTDEITSAKKAAVALIAATDDFLLYTSKQIKK